MAILRSFSEYLFYRAPMGNCLLLVEVEEFQPPTTDSVKSYFTNAFQAFYTKTRSIHSKALFSQSPCKLSVKKLICNEVVRYQSAGLRKKLFHTSSFVYFAVIFSECITITSSEETLKVWSTISFRRK